MIDFSDLRQSILDVLRKKGDTKLNYKQIAHRLKLDDKYLKDVKAEISDLVHEGKLIMDRDQKVSMRDENKVLRGVVKRHQDGFGFFIPDDKEKSDVFIPERSMNFAMNGDSVLVESFKGQKEGKYEGRIIQILKRAHETLVGTFHRLGDQSLVRFRDSKLGLSEIYIPKKNAANAANDDLVAVRVIQYPGYGIQAIGEVVKIVGDEVNPENLKEGVLIEHHIKRAFPDAIHREVASFPAEIDDAIPSGRLDLTRKPIITIDGVTAKDFDDAVFAERSAQGYVLYVCIADVAHYVTRGSQLDKEALARATSVYLADECIPMLPEKLSNGLCSLNPHVPRYTLTAEIHYNSNLDVHHVRFYESVIKSHKRATYDEVQAYFDGTGGNDFTPAVKASLDLMKIMAEKLIEKTDSRGAMNFDLPEAEFIFDAHGKLSRIRKRQRFFSHKLIEQFMIAANVAVGEFMSSEGVPTLYRVHDSPDRVKIQSFISMVQNMGLGEKLAGFHPADFFKNLKGHPQISFLESVFLRSLKQAQYTPTNIGHFGLALGHYLHFTSPIRRYPDLIVHRSLKHEIQKCKSGILEYTREVPIKLKEPPLNLVYSFDELEELGSHTSFRERDAMEAERSVADIIRVFFMKGHTGERFEAKVTRLTRTGAIVEIDTDFVEGFVALKDMTDDYYEFDEKKIRLVGQRTRRIIRIGDRMSVRVLKVDTEKLSVQLVPDEKSRPIPKAQNHVAKKFHNKKSKPAFNHPETQKSFGSQKIDPAKSLGDKGNEHKKNRKLTPRDPEYFDFKKRFSGKKKKNKK